MLRSTFSTNFCFFIIYRGRNACTKKFVCQVYVEFPEIILIDNWKWKTEEMSLTEDDISSVLDTISHGLITAIANTEDGKDWARMNAHDYEICLRKLASLHPTLLIRYLLYIIVSLVVK